MTFQDVINDVRVVLNDSQGVRYTTPELLSYANDGVQEGFRLRPDFRFGNYTAAAQTYVAGDTIPFPSAYRMLLKHYVCFRAELRDDEYSQDGRAAALLSRFQAEMTK
jgi:hypothetical protein